MRISSSRMTFLILRTRDDEIDELKSSEYSYFPQPAPGSRSIIIEDRQPAGANVDGLGKQHFSSAC